jgi:uncharacterized membrane protein YbaN (DUF454 family)
MPRKAKRYALLSILMTGAISVWFTEGTAPKVAAILLLLIPTFIILKIRSTESLSGHK